MSEPVYIVDWRVGLLVHLVSRISGWPMKQDNNHSQKMNTQSDAEYMHGAAVIDDQGKETPITEEMIQQALNNILKACQQNH